MFQYDLKIADLVIRIESQKRIVFDECFQPFLEASDSSGRPDIRIEVQFYEKDVLAYEKGEKIADNILKAGDRIIRRYALQEKEYLYRIEYTGRKDFYRLEVPELFKDSFCNRVNMLLYLSMERLLLPFRRILLHASAVIYNGRAYIFTAPSGGGKSTHAALWEKYYDAEILNGDKVIIKTGADGCMAYGGPIAGSSGIYKQKKAPVAAIVFLEKGTRNKVRTEIKRKGYLKLYSQLIKSTWDEEYNCRLLELAEMVIKTTPVVTLTCTAEREAVECIKNHLERL